MQALRLLSEYMEVLLDYSSPLVLFAAIVAFVGVAFVIAWGLTGLDSTLSWASDFVPLALGVTGVGLTVRRVRDKHEGSIIAVLIIIGIFGSVLI
jgi:uncharacterized membrane protein YhaH (DUF805 family)